MMFFFFKQKTAYEMRISDWSSDVCSSDLMMRPTTGSSRTRRIHRILPPVLAPEPSTFTMAQMSRARTIRPKIPPISRSMIHLPRVADPSREQRLRQDHVHVVVLASPVPFAPPDRHRPRQGQTAAIRLAPQ